jgi:cbb3-type cytochrome oxidase subunit 1
LCKKIQISQEALIDCWYTESAVGLILGSSCLVC